MLSLIVITYKKMRYGERYLPKELGKGNIRFISGINVYLAIYEFDLGNIKLIASNKEPFT